MHNAQLSQHQAVSILDVGHGTGIWVYEMAQRARNANVVGIDLYSRTPRRETAISNASFLTPVDFRHPQWPFEPDSHHLIRMSQLCGCVSDWHALYLTASRYIRPGNGYIEHVEFDWTPRCFDGHVFPPHAAPLAQWWDAMQRASHRAGRPMALPEDVESLLARCGFADTMHRTVRIPLQRRDHDRRDWDLYWAFKTAMSLRLEDGRAPQAFESLSMSLFTRHLRFPPDTVAAWCNALRAVFEHTATPLYFNL